MRKTHGFKVIGLAAATLLIAAACGGGGSSDGGTDSTDGASGDALKFGYILPETGDLAFLGPPQIEALKYAIKQINDAGGVLGQQIGAPVGGDEANDAAVAAQSTTRVLSQNVNAIIGAAASGMSLAIIDSITGAGVAQCSGSNTAPTFTNYDDNGLYIRTAPSDAIQGPVLADTIVADGHSKVAIVARADDYGRGLADATAKALESAGASVVLNDTYDTKATDFAGVVQKIVAAQPDAVAVVAFEEGKQIFAGVLEAGLKPPTVGIYGSDGMRSEELAKLVDPSNPAVLNGVKGTAPASAENEKFNAELKAFAPSLKELQFAPQIVDCVNVIALAAEQAKSVNANDFKKFLVDVTKDGEKCTTFADCKKLIADGKDIDYDGFSGPLDFTDAGEPAKATIEVYGYDETGALKTLATKEGTAPTS